MADTFIKNKVGHHLYHSNGGDSGGDDGDCDDDNFISIFRKNGGQSHRSIKLTNRIAMR